MAAVDLYLKYFHSKNKNLEKKLAEIEFENDQKEQGLVDSNHIDNLRNYSVILCY
jgi:hypothetical protein